MLPTFKVQHSIEMYNRIMRIYQQYKSIKCGANENAKYNFSSIGFIESIFSIINNFNAFCISYFVLKALKSFECHEFEVKGI